MHTAEGLSRARRPRCESLLAAVVLLLAIGSTARAQICIETAESLGGAEASEALVAVDLDGDGDVDLASAGGTPGRIVVHWNLGDFVFAPPVLVAQTSPTYGAADITSGDFDGDGNLDLATASGPGVSLFLQAPVGTFVAQPPVPVPQSGRWICAGDFDGDLDVDLATASRIIAGPDTVSILLNQGLALFAAPIVHPIGLYAFDIDVADVDLDGDLDLAVSENGGNSLSILRNQGGAVFAPRETWAAGLFPCEIESADLDLDGDADWVVADAFTSTMGALSTLSVLWNDGTGGYPNVTSLFVFPASSPRSVTTGDLDQDGDADIAATSWNGYLQIFENLGGGAFALPITIPIGGYTIGLAVADFEGDGDLDLAAVEPWQGSEIWRNCAISGVPYCFGDGSGTACPCGNASSPSARAGCRNSTGLDPTLRAGGSARLSQDELVLAGAGLPNSSVLYFQGTNAITGGVVFGDGLRCAGGSIARLGIATNVANASQYPSPGQLPVSVRGGVTSAGSRVYQAWFRDAATFCTSATFGLTNGVRVVWQP